MGADVFTCAVCAVFCAFTFLFFAPLEVILLNFMEFRFSFDGVWLFQLTVAFGAAAILFGLLLLLPPKVRRIAEALVTGGTLAAWVQTMFLNNSMISLTGDEMQVSRSQTILNLLIWAGIIAGFTVLVIFLAKRKGKTADIVIRAAGAALTAMQCVALVSLVLTTDTSSRSVHLLSSEGEFEFGTGRNVIMIVADTADEEYFREILEKYPELNESLSGWTYYTNAVSTYSRTYPSLPYLITGQKCWFDTPKTEYVSKAFRESTFLKTIAESGTDVRLFTTEDHMIGNDAYQYIANGIDAGNEKAHLYYPQLEKNLVKIFLYKCMPYALKNMFRYEVGLMNLSSFDYRPFRECYDPSIYQKLISNGGIRVTDKLQDTYKLFHLWSSHLGANWNAELEVTGERNYPEALRGTFKFIEKLIDELRNKGIYDQTMIIVTADHGIPAGDNKQHERTRATCPIMLVKYPDSDLQQPLSRNHAPVCHDDLFETTYRAFGRKGDPYGSGKALEDYTEGEDRTRIHYFEAVDERLVEVEMVEYAIHGDAYDFSSWEKTGNRWEIKQ